MLYSSFIVRLQLNLHIKDLSVGVLPLLVELLGIELVLPLVKGLKHVRREVDLSFLLEVECLLPLSLLHLMLELGGVDAVKLSLNHGLHLFCSNSFLETVLVFS